MPEKDLLESETAFQNAVSFMLTLDSLTDEDFLAWSKHLSMLGESDWEEIRQFYEGGTIAVPNLVRLNDESFCALIQKAGIKSLKIDRSQFANLSADQRFLLAIKMKNLGITSLAFCCIGDGADLTPQQWQDFAPFFEKLKIENLDLSENNLSNFTEDHWIALSNILERGQIVSLNLSNNSLDEKSFEVAEMIKGTYVTDIEFEKNSPILNEIQDVCDKNRSGKNLMLRSLSHGIRFTLFKKWGLEANKTEGNNCIVTFNCGNKVFERELTNTLTQELLKIQPEDLNNSNSCTLPLNLAP